MNPIGGYFSLEVNAGHELHTNALHLNAGRFALEYILKARKYRKIYLPYYICDSVLEPIKRLNVSYEFFHIDEKLEPVSNLEPRDDEAVLYVNYFGLKNNFSDSFCYNYKNTILDYTQAFYANKGNRYDNKALQCDTFYSCRKYFGVADGAYLYTDSYLNEKIPRDESFERMTFLTKRIDRSPQEAYEDFQTNDQSFSEAGLRRMSRLTEAIMSGIDYSATANKRIHNFHTLNAVLGKNNHFKWAMDFGTIPLVYPYLIDNGAQLRDHLITNQVYCARYWPNVIEWCKPTDFEYYLAENLVCLPIDQRYGEREMHIILDLITNFR